MRATTVGAMVIGVLLIVGCGADPATGPPSAVVLPEVSPSRTPEPLSLADFPDETTTGVPDGIELEPSGSVRVTEDGAVVEGLEITGTVTVLADDVVIRNTRILNTGEFAIRVDGGNRLLVEDTEIDGQGIGGPAVVFSDYTLRRVDIHHVTEGPRIAGSNVTIEDSYIHHLVQKGDNHTDAIQAVSGRNLVLRGNRVEAQAPDTGGLGNAAFMFGEEDAELENCVVENNYFDGGNYTVNGGGGGTAGAECSFAENSFGRSFRYGPAGNLGENTHWEDTNVWIGSHDPVKAED
jgi:hypothetical protein